MDFAFCPDEGLGGFVVVGDEILDMGDEFWNTLEGGSVERLSREDREPDFDLVEPGGVRSLAQFKTPRRKVDRGPSQRVLDPINRQMNVRAGKTGLAIKV